MIRLLIVLVVVVVAAFWMNYGSHDSPGHATARPEVRYQESTREAQDLEQQMQDQARQQLDAIDAASD